MRVAGIMSGTSLDGVDVAVVDLRGAGWRTRFEVVTHSTTPYPRAVRQALLEVSNTNTHTASIARLHHLLSHLYADAVERTCRRADLTLDSLELIGCHGQTIFHEGAPIPFLGRRIASTLQIGEAAILAERLRVPVISDFRPADMAAGGRGAPLVPYVDYLLFRHPRRGRVALNLGGIGNLTAIPAGAAPEQVVAFDTGPGNMVIDALVSEQTAGKETYDRGGRHARRGSIDEALLRALLRDRYYRQPPPKSAGREQYGPGFVAHFAAAGVTGPDAIATATRFTAETVALGLRRHVLPHADMSDLVVSGGGVHNPTLMRALQEALPELKVTPSGTLGIDPDAKEAIAFAILAYESFHGRPANLPSATGARRPAVLGKLSRP